MEKQEGESGSTRFRELKGIYSFYTDGLLILIPLVGIARHVEGECAIGIKGCDR